MEVQVCQGDKVPQEMQGSQWVVAPEATDFGPHCNIYPHIAKQFYLYRVRRVLLASKVTQWVSLNNSISCKTPNLFLKCLFSPARETQGWQDHGDNKVLKVKRWAKHTSFIKSYLFSLNVPLSSLCFGHSSGWTRVSCRIWGWSSREERRARHPRNPSKKLEKRMILRILHNVYVYASQFHDSSCKPEISVECVFSLLVMLCIKGTPGQSGIDGTKGAAGLPGIPGQDGRPGLPGTTGLSFKVGVRCCFCSACVCVPDTVK